MSDSGRVWRSQCARCGKRHESVDRHTDWTCPACLMDRPRVLGSPEAMGALVAEKEREIRDLTDRLAIAEGAAADLPDIQRSRDAAWTRGAELEAVIVELNAKLARTADGAYDDRLLALAEELRVQWASLSRSRRENEQLHQHIAILRELREFDASAIGRLQTHRDELFALLVECREWLMAGGISSRTKLGYVDFHRRLDAALGGPPTWPGDIP